MYFGFWSVKQHSLVCVCVISFGNKIMPMSCFMQPMFPQVLVARRGWTLTFTRLLQQTFMLGVWQRCAQYVCDKVDCAVHELSFAVRGCHLHTSSLPNGGSLNPTHTYIFLLRWETVVSQKGRQNEKEEEPLTDNRVGQGVNCHSYFLLNSTALFRLVCPTS